MAKSRTVKLVVSGLLVFFAVSHVNAQSLKDVLKALRNMKPPGQEVSAPKVAPGAMLAPANSIGDGQVQGAKSPSSFGAKITERYCKNLFSVASMESRGPVDENLVAEEFDLDAAGFYDEAIKALDARPGHVSFTFPSRDFYKHEFETDKINVIFDLLLSYPSPKYAAALIAEARSMPGQPRYDDQAKTDAVAALAILHFRMQHKSRSANRWAELAASLANEDHYLAKVISARLSASGEIGPVNVGRALTLANEANNARASIQRDSMKKISPRNYQITSNQTLFDVLTANPGHPQRRNFAQFMQVYERNRNMTEPLPEVTAQIGPGLAQVERTSRAAAERAKKMLEGANAAGNMQAQKASLDSVTRNRVSDSADNYADARATAAMNRELRLIDKLTEEQSQLLDQSRKLSYESGDLAISMMPQMMGVMMNIMMQRGMEYLPTVIPIAKKLQSYSDSACSVVSRLDHTLMVRKLAVVDQDRSLLANMVSAGD